MKPVTEASADDVIARHEAQQRRRLRVALTALACLGFAFTALWSVVTLVAPASPGWRPAVVAGLVGLAMAAALVVERRRGERAGALVASTAPLLLPPLSGLAAPEGANVQLVLPLLAIAFAVNHLRGRSLLAIVGATLASALATVAILGIHAVGRGNESVTGAVLLGTSALVTVGTAALLLWQYSHRANELISDVGEAHARLAAANLSKTEFMNNAAHELRTPLTPVKVQLHLLRKDAIGGDAQARERALTVVERNVTRLERLVGDLLDASRLGADRLRLDQSAVDAARVVRESVEAYRATADIAGVRLTEDAACGLAVRGDPERLAQVLDNLVSNALKFTPAGGSVHVAARRGPDGSVEVRVTDSGIGIAADELGRLFHAFHQVEFPSRARHGGVGLGLFIARGIAQAHGGTLTAASAGEGRGATFTLRLPALPVAPLQPTGSVAGANAHT